MTYREGDDLSHLDKSIKVEFECSSCHKVASKKVLSLFNNFLCRSCIAKNARASVDTSKIDYKKRAETARKTSLEKYGVENPMQLQSVRDRIHKNNIEKYGCHPSQLQEVKDRQAQTNTERYGTKAASQNESVKSKYRQSCELKYGTGITNSFQADSVKQKIKDTLLDKYGVDNIQKLDSTVRKTKATCLERYGVECCFNIHNKSSYEYDGINFDSRPELAFYIYCKDNSINIERNISKSFTYEYNGKQHSYFPDFNIDDKLYEIKGRQFLKSSGEWQNPYDHSQDDIYEAKHQCALLNNVNIIYDYDKYIDYVNIKYTNSYLDLFKVGLNFPYPNSDLSVTTDLGLIHHFHKSIYEASKLGCLSPFEAWNDKDLIKKVALNRLKYVKSCRPSDILQGFSVTRLAPKISVFSPKLATDLTSKYLSDCDEVVDPFSGFSGRLLGVTNLNKRYIGKDIHEGHVAESNEIIQFRNLNATVVVEDLLQKQNIEEYECLFTCPPYGAKEHWNKRKDEIELTCDEWIDVCLQKYKCKKYLFVVDHTDKYKDYTVDYDLGKKQGLFHKYNEEVILIAR